MSAQREHFEKKESGREREQKVDVCAPAIFPLLLVGLSTAAAKISTRRIRGQQQQRQQQCAELASSEQFSAPVRAHHRLQRSTSTQGTHNH